VVVSESVTGRTASGGEPDIARIGALIGDPTRARVLVALADGRALTASRLASEAGVAPSTVSEHLSRLTAAGLVVAHAQGRARFYQLASPAVADALEAIARISPIHPVKSLRQDTRAHALRKARTCYTHLAGRLGVSLLSGMLARGLMTGGDGLYHPEQAVNDRLSGPGRDVSYQLTPLGKEAFTGIGIDLRPILAKRPAIRYCLDWSEQRHHLAGPLGAALASRLFALGWVRKASERRVVTLTDDGCQHLVDVFGLSPNWDQPEPGPARTTPAAGT
jgi:DNA-binding transcriptional ArsR family regulator